MLSAHVCVGPVHVCVGVHTCAHEHLWSRRVLWSMCKGSHAHRGGDKGQDMCLRSPGVKGPGRPAPRPHASPPYGPLVLRALPGLLVGRVCPARRGPGGTQEGRQRAPGLWHSVDMRRGGGSRLQPRPPGSPCRRAALGMAGRSPHARRRPLVCTSGHAGPSGEGRARRGAWVDRLLAGRCLGQPPVWG